ncbi:hypothetical protein VNO77_27297 [Canavalia gladiata]|uniref:Uncharacterized protein n=1 Tax=Canavalia gladiata TaxID=3824 RepID=A0AAN9KWZ6_CANGL
MHATLTSHEGSHSYYRFVEFTPLGTTPDRSRPMEKKYSLGVMLLVDQSILVLRPETTPPQPQKKKEKDPLPT